jgi:ubiquinone biosynthesis monooxygenase Coq7
MNMTASETGKKLSSKTEQMIRVDHAGEHGAVSIYRGQLAVFGNTDQKAEIAELVKHMAEQEQLHMDSFDKLILEKNIRPTALAPLWDAAGFTLGAVTALMGEKAAMACTAAVEEVIDTHYADQIKELEKTGEEADLRDMIEEFRADEVEHRDTAIEYGAEDMKGYEVLRSLIRFGCRAAIKISEKI